MKQAAQIMNTNIPYSNFYLIQNYTCLKLCQLCHLLTIPEFLDMSGQLWTRHNFVTMTALNQGQNMIIQNPTGDKGVCIPFVGLGKLEEHNVAHPMITTVVSFHLSCFPRAETTVFKRTQIW